MDSLEQRIRKLAPEKRSLFEQRLKQRGLKGPEASTEAPSPGAEPAVQSNAIAIIGISCRLPAADDPEAFWELLRAGVDAISEIPPTRWDVDSYFDENPAAPGKMYSRWGGFIDGVDQFSPDFFNIPADEAKRIDPQHRLLLELSWEVLERAGYASAAIGGSDTGVFLGMSTNDYLGMQFSDPTGIRGYTGTGNARCLAANRISYQYDLRGPSFVIDTACSSSLYAIHLACQSLRSQETSMCIAGAVNLMLSPQPSITFSQARMLAADGRCKTFDASADGYVRGEGAGLVLLKRFSDAVRDGDSVLAVIRGAAVNQDGLSNGITAPNGPAQQTVIRAALRNAGLRPADIGYVEAHGTGTRLGDPIEVGALTEVLGAGRDDDRSCRLGSVKTNIGHLEAAAGIAGLIKIILCMQNEAIVPHLHLKQLNPHIPNTRLPFTVPVSLEPWLRGPTPRYAGLSSFGFGGANAHVIVEEGPAEVERHSAHERSGQILSLSAQSETALSALALRFADHVDANPTLSLAQVCYSANVGRRMFSQRLAVCADTLPGLSEALRRAASGERMPGVWTGEAQAGCAPKLVFLFTGQGSQYVGMARELYESQARFRSILDRCSHYLEPHLEGGRLLDYLYPGTETDSRLDETWLTQPALFAVEYALAQLWISWGVKPDALLGHSVGEYVAACIAGVFTLEEGLGLIAARGRLMNALPSGGGMAAVMAGAEQVEALLRSQGGRLQVAAYNGPELVTISGRREELDALYAALSSRGIQYQPLSVSHAFHSHLMEPMLESYREVLEQVEFRAARIPVMGNVRGDWWGEGEAGVEYWLEQIRSPVQFEQGMRALSEAGYGAYVEVGPKATLLGMSRAWLAAQSVCVPSLLQGSGVWETLLPSLSQLYTSGVQVDWQGYEQDYVNEGSRRRIPLPTYPFERQRCWYESVNMDSGFTAVAESVADRCKDFLYQYRWVQEPRAAGDNDSSEPGVWLLFGAEDDLSEELTQCLASRGDSCIRITGADTFSEIDSDRYEICPTSLSDVQQLLRVVLDSRRAIKGIVHQWSLVPASERVESVDEFVDLQSSYLTSIAYLLQALQLENYRESLRIWLVTRAAHAVTDEVRSVEVSQAATWGFGRVLAHEYPNWWGGMIDLGPVPSRAEAECLVSEILDSDKLADEIAYHEGARYVGRLRRFDGVTGSAATISADHSYLVLGGLGGIGSAVSRWLFAKGARNLILTGRSELSKVKAGLLKELEDGGCRVRYFSVDAADHTAMSEIFAWIEREMPGLKGVIHTAGVLEDTSIDKLDWSGIRKVLRPKIGGSWVLDRLTEQYALDFFILFSSAGAFLGSPGQAAYAAANACLDGFAQLRGSKGSTAISVNWGPWANVGMASRLGESDQARLSAYGISSISPERALAALDVLLSATEHNIAVLDIDWQRYISSTGIDNLSSVLSEFANVDTGEDSRPGVQNKAALLADYQDLARSQRCTWLTDYLQERVSRALGREKSHTGEHHNFMEIGMDSIRFIEVINGINQDFDVTLYPTEFQEYPTIHDMATYLMGLMDDDCSPQEPAVKKVHVGSDVDSWARGQRKGDMAAHPWAISRSANPCFLLSSPRSGSTLLRVMLSAHPDLFCPPELHLLPFADMKTRNESLNGSYLGEGLVRAFMELNNLSADDATHFVTDLVERNASTAEVYDLLQSGVDGRGMVDKSPSYAANLDTLLRAEFMFPAPKYIHLVRHPYSVIDSFVKNRMDKAIGLEADDPYVLAEEIWTRCNHNIDQLMSQVDPERCITVCYEELASEPEKIIREICGFLDLPFSRAMLYPYQAGHMTDGLHSTSMSIGDPNFLKRTKVDADLAVAWKSIVLPHPLGPAALEIAGKFSYQVDNSKRDHSEVREAVKQLVVIQAKGDRPPLFCIHPSGGQVYAYHGLVSVLGHDQPIFGIQSRALVDISREHSSIETMAHEYAKIIQEQQPEGPYHLLGWSMGGRLVLAISKELEARGEEVRFAGLWDCRYPPIDASVLVDQALPDISMAFGGSLIDLVAGLGEEGKRQLIEALSEQPEDKRLRYIIEWAQKQDALPQNVSADLLHDQAALVDYHIHILRAHKPPNISAPLHVWWARDGLQRRPATDWCEYTSGKVVNHVVDGNHFSMVRPPIIHELAQQVKQRLDECGSTRVSALELSQPDVQGMSSEIR